MESLRQEILQAQTIRSDLIKWKLALVAGLGAAGLGFAGSTDLRDADLVLCAIPPVCVYVDLLCRHLSLRILVVGRFLYGAAGDDLQLARLAAYEDFAQRTRTLPVGDGRRRSAFDLEDWALSWSSFALSVAVFVYGLTRPEWIRVPFLVSGIVGLVATWLAHRLFRDRFDRVVALSEGRAPGGAVEIDASAPAVARGEIEIAAPPEVVWGVLTDVERWPRWNPDVKSAALAGPLAEGTHFRWKSGPATISSMLRVVDAPRLVAWTGSTLGIRAVHVHRLEEKDGATLVVTEESWDGLLVRVLGRSFTRTLQKAIDSGLAHLKTEAERTTSSRG